MANTSYYESRIINSLAVSDPRMNTGLGTPIRKIITAVANELSGYDTERQETTSLYSLNSVSGTELEFLVGMFGFARQAAVAAVGEITLKRDNPDSVLVIPAGSSFNKPATATDDAVVFTTTAYGEMREGVLQTTIPIVCTVAGAQGNVAANTIISGGEYGQYVSITNESPTYGGVNIESDDELRARFLLTIFRNEAGTTDQILGLAYANESVTRALVIGQESRYTETLMVLRKDSPTTMGDLSDVEFYVEPTATRVHDLVRNDLSRNGRVWVRNADTGLLINYGAFEPAYQSDVLCGIKFNGEDVQEVFIADGTNMVLNLSNLPVMTGSVTVRGEDAGGQPVTVTYTVDEHAGTVTLTNAPAAGTNLIVEYEKCVVNATSDDPTTNQGTIVTLEFDYLSNYNRGGSNDVDVYIDGLAYQTASDIQYANMAQSIDAGNQANWVFDDGTLPPIGSWYLIPSRQPVLAIGKNISTGASMLLKDGETFKFAHDATNLAGSQAAQDAVVLLGTANGTQFTPVGWGTYIEDGQPIYIPYSFNSDVRDVQNLITVQSPITMDVLVHAANRPYFVFNIDVMYTVYQRDSIKQQIDANIREWASDLPFGATVQFSDIETVGANTPGVDNIKITSVEKVTSNGTSTGVIYTNDFTIAPNEVLEVYSVVITDKVQSNWGL